MFVNCQHAGRTLTGSLANIHTWLGQGRLVRQGISVSVPATWRPAQRMGGPESEGGREAGIEDLPRNTTLSMTWLISSDFANLNRSRSSQL